jgi:hypothetical protein
MHVRFCCRHSPHCVEVPRLLSGDFILDSGGYWSTHSSFQQSEVSDSCKEWTAPEV